MSISSYQYWAEQNKVVGFGRRLKTWVERKYLKIVLDHLTDQSPGGRRASLLEIGPGKGFFAHEASRHMDYTALDYSASLVRTLREQGVECAHARFPHETEAVDGRSFDCIYMSHVLEHFDTRSEAVDAVLKCKALLKTSGILVINCPNYMSHGSLFWESDYTHNFVTTPRRVEALCHDCGYEVVYVTRMVFGVENGLARAVLGFVGVVVPEPVFKVLISLLVRNYTGNPKVHFKENFTVVARKATDGDR